MEIYKDIEGYEGIYAVSNIGNVLSFERFVTGKNGCKYKKKQTLLKQKTDRYGYKAVGLWNGETVKWITVHRLVATAFLGKKDGLQVNHINGLKDDNRLENLEWVTQSDNMKHSYSILGRKPNWNRVGTIGEGAIRNKPLRVFYPCGKVEEFYAVTKAIKETGISLSVCTRLLNGSQKQTRMGIRMEYIKKEC